MPRTFNLITEATPKVAPSQPAPKAEVHLEPLMDAEEVASYFGVPVNTLYLWHSRGDAPPAIRLGKSRLRWRASDVQRWLDQRQCQRQD
jgi:predicted DNA-binding transcriptional regulator AlpA